MDLAIALVITLAGTAAGAGLGWFIARVRYASRAAAAGRDLEIRMAVLEEKVSNEIERNTGLIRERQKIEDQLNGMEVQASEAQKRGVALHARFEEQGRLLADRELKVAELEESLERVRTENANLKAKQAEVETVLVKERESAERQLQAVRDAEQRLKDTFETVAAQALRNTQGTFFELARASFEKIQTAAKTDFERSHLVIGQSVKPVQESLQRLNEQISALEKERVSSHAGLSEMLRSLSASTAQLDDRTSKLVNALTTPRVRGRWGEIQLKRVVEIAGMTAYCDFTEQESVASGNGHLRPDMIVKLPGGKSVVVDSKAPLEAFLQAVQASGESAHKDSMENHARQVRDHVRKLSQKAYWEQFKTTPEFVVLFLPGESFFSAALEHDPELIEFAVGNRVILANPMTLIALLKAVAYGWRHENLAENARAISDLGKELYKRISDLSKAFSGVGKNLAEAVTAYNRAVGSLESRVLVSARRFRDLEAAGDYPEIDPLTTADAVPRLLTASEYREGHAREGHAGFP